MVSEAESETKLMVRGWYLCKQDDQKQVRVAGVEKDGPINPRWDKSVFCSLGVVA
jgi:hypothetical protein